jgi:hypothetical protein
MKQKSIELTTDNWRQWEPWERVLVYWKSVFCRHGITVQALAEICQIPSEELWKAVRRHPNIGGCYCDQLRAPVLVIRVHRHTEWNPEGGITRTFSAHKAVWKGSEHGYANAVATRKMARLLTYAYPWPEFKGLRREKGVRRFTPKASLALLRKVAAGQINPWTGVKNETGD